MGSNSLHVLKGIDFSVKEGEMVSIMGSSGSGKSTLLEAFNYLIHQKVLTRISHNKAPKGVTL